MTAEIVTTVAEVVGAVAVIVSILYLAMQVRDNTRTVRANAGFEAAHSWATTNDVLFQAPKEDLKALMRAFEGEPPDTFSDEERVSISVFMRSVFQKLEGQYFLFKYGSVDEVIWENRRQWGAGLVRTPFFAQWWKIEKSQLIYTAEFIRLIESARPIEITGFADEANHGAI